MTRVVRLLKESSTTKERLYQRMRSISYTSFSKISNTLIAHRKQVRRRKAKTLELRARSKGVGISCVDECMEDFRYSPGDVRERTRN